MYYVRLFGLLALPLVLAGPTIGAPAANGARDADQLAKQYGLKVFDHVLGSAREPAIIMSPYSLTSALDMLALGADGATARLFRQQGITRPHQRGQDVYRSLTSGSNPGPTLRIANSAWLTPHAKPRPRFVNAIRRSYDARITTLDFSRPDAASKINAWVNSATQEMIPQVVDSIDPTDAVRAHQYGLFQGEVGEPLRHDRYQGKPVHAFGRNQARRSHDERDALGGVRGAAELACDRPALWRRALSNAGGDIEGADQGG